MACMPTNMATTPRQAYLAWVRGVSGERAMSCRVIIPTEHSRSAMMTMARSTGQSLVMKVEMSHVPAGSATAKASA